MTYESLANKLQKSLGLPAAAIMVRRIGIAHRPLITLIDPTFEHKSELERQRDVRRRLQEAGIDPNELGFIMTNTPEEDQALRDDVIDEPESGSLERL